MMPILNQELSPISWSALKVAQFMNVYQMPTKLLVKKMENKSFQSVLQLIQPMVHVFSPKELKLKLMNNIKH